jgi:hypothetical protein
MSKWSALRFDCALTICELPKQANPRRAIETSAAKQAHRDFRRCVAESKESGAKVFIGSSSVTLRAALAELPESAPHARASKRLG